MMIARIVDVGTSDHMRVKKLNQLNSSSRGCKSPTYLHSGTQMLMFAHVYFHRLVFLQKNKCKGGRKASLFFIFRVQLMIGSCVESVYNYMVGRRVSLCKNLSVSIRLA
jgi:hypothetical protein